MKPMNFIQVTQTNVTLCGVVLFCLLAVAQPVNAAVFTWGDGTMPNPQDWDGDGILNTVDTDNDNDGTADATDGSPYNPHSTKVAGAADNSSSSNALDSARLHNNAMCYNSYSDWDGNTWQQLKTDLGEGIASFSVTGEDVIYSSGNCSQCAGWADITAKLDLANQEYWFEGAMTFSRPGYDNVSASITTDKIAFNYVQFSGGSFYLKTLYQNDLETSEDYNWTRTQTNPNDATDTLAATLDLDFNYDACLSDPDDLKTTKIGVKGRVMIHYETSSESGFTHLWSTTGALQPAP